MHAALFKQETSSLYTRTLELAPQTLEQLIVTCNSSTQMKSALNPLFSSPNLIWKNIYLPYNPYINHSFQQEQNVFTASSMYQFNHK